MKKRFLAAVLTLVLCLSLSPALAAEPDWDGPGGKDAGPTVCDTGRGYIVYYFFTPDVYYSPDGVTWTDLSDRSWVRQAGAYIYSSIGFLGRREFQLIWTGNEYMLRQSLMDDPRGTHRRVGDSPRNSIVSFLANDLKVLVQKGDDAVSGHWREDL